MTSLSTQPFRSLRALALALVVTAVPLAAQAQANPASLSPDSRSDWSKRAAEMRTRVAAAALREQAATAAYSRMLTRRYPAGDAKLAIIDERDSATKAYADAVTELHAFKAEARAEGVPDSWIDPEGTPPPWWLDSSN